MQNVRPIHILLTFAMTLGMTFNLCANVIMLDYRYVANGGTNSPYHTENGGFTDTGWNAQGQSSDSSLVWSDGTTAVGVGTRTFKGNSGSSSVTSAGWSASFSGSAVNTGVYTSPSIGIGGYMMSSTFTDERSIGIQAYGLAAGQYDVYIVGRNTDYTAQEYTLNYYAGAGAATGAFDFAGYDSASMTYAANSTDKTSEWIFDPLTPGASNYVKLNVTLTVDNPYLNIGTIGNGVNGVFNAVQIVSVPEPSSLALLAGALGFLALAVRRHRKR